jgi:hypothetical protein
MHSHRQQREREREAEAAQAAMRGEQLGGILAEGRKASSQRQREGDPRILEERAAMGVWAQQQGMGVVRGIRRSAKHTQGATLAATLEWSKSTPLCPSCWRANAAGAWLPEPEVHVCTSTIRGSSSTEPSSEECAL